jgi:hypothetical protein
VEHWVILSGAPPVARPASRAQGIRNARIESEPARWVRDQPGMGTLESRFHDGPLSTALRVRVQPGRAGQERQDIFGEITIAQIMKCAGYATGALVTLQRPQSKHSAVDFDDQNSRALLSGLKYNLYWRLVHQRPTRTSLQVLKEFEAQDQPPGQDPAPPVSARTRHSSCPRDFCLADVLLPAYHRTAGLSR